MEVELRYEMQVQQIDQLLMVREEREEGYQMERTHAE